MLVTLRLSLISTLRLGILVTLVGFAISPPCAVGQQPAAGRATIAFLGELAQETRLALPPCEIIKACDQALGKPVLRDADRKALLSLRSQAHFALGEFRAAKDDIEAVLRIAPTDRQSRCRHARVLMALGRVKEGMGELQALYKEAPNDTHVNLALALGNLAQGNTKECIRFADQTIAKDKDNAGAFALRGQAYKTSRTFDLAYRDLLRALELDPRGSFRYPEAPYLHVGDALFDLNRHEESLGYFFVAQRLQPGCFLAQYGIYRAYAAMGKYRIAEHYSDGLLHDFPHEVRAYLAAAHSAMAFQRYQNAEANAKHALELDPRNFEAIGLLGSIADAQGDTPAALSCYHKALHINPNYAPVMAALAQLLLDNEPESRQARQRALALANKACQLSHRRDAQDLHVLARCQCAAGDYEDALQTAKEATKRATYRADIRKASRELIQIIETQRKRRD